MTKSLNFGLKIKGGVVGRVAHATSSDPATPPPRKSLKRAPCQVGQIGLRVE